MTTSAQAVPFHAPDWSSAGEETIRHLQQLIRLETVNPPGNEILVARYLDQTLRAEGIETTLLEPAPGRAALVARLRGNGAGRPVLLLAHMDVVGVEREHWSVDPFGGVVKDGYLYGRGAIDDKGMLAANLETMLLLKRHVADAGGTLARDVVLVATSDEEAGGEWGIGWLADHHPELVEAEYAINEGGRTRIVGGRTLYMAVQSAEKVAHVVTVTAHGPGGHASVPLRGNALLRLGRALAALGEHREPVVLTPVTRGFFADLAHVWPDEAEGRAMADVAGGDAAKAADAARALESIPVLDALLRASVSATMLSGGVRVNVIPTEASASLNVRTLPGQSVDEVVARLARAIGDPLVELRVTSRGEDAPPSDIGSPMFLAIAAAARALEPELVVVPYLSTGATDSAELRRRGVHAYGILPFPMVPDDEGRMHGNDERIPLASLRFGTRVIHDAVRLIAERR